MKPFKSDFDTKGSWLFKFVPIVIAIVFVVMVAYWVVFGVFVTKVVTEVDQKGLKSIVERIWEGPKK